MSTVPVRLTVNGQPQEVDVEPRLLLVHLLRDTLGLTGTHVGCDTTNCGACTVHLDGEAVRSCVVPLSRAAGKSVTTIEGLSRNGDHPLQQAWVALAVPQCGFCQAGQIMSAAALLAANPAPSDEDIDQSMCGNLCRCGTYPRIRAAIRQVADNSKR